LAECFAHIEDDNTHIQYITVLYFFQNH